MNCTKTNHWAATRRNISRGMSPLAEVHMNQPDRKHDSKRHEDKAKLENDDVIEESTEGDGGPTGSGGVASQSPSPGPEPKQPQGHKRG